jgi:hypothetical protein
MNLTYGATRDRLLQNGYAAASLLRPDRHDFEVSDDPAAVMAIPRSHSWKLLPDNEARQIFAIVITTKDAALRKAIVTLFDALSIGGGPTCTNSAGAEIRIFRNSSHDPMLQRSSETVKGSVEPAVVLATWERRDPRFPPISALIPLSGEWKNGSPLTVKHSTLPELLDADAIRLFTSLHDVMPRTPFVMPEISTDRKPSPSDLSRPRMVGPRCKRDLANNPNAIQAMGEAAYSALPDFLPEETPTGGDPRLASRLPRLIDRVFGR